MDINGLLARLVQVGTVSAVDKPGRKARVILKETGHTSGWLCVLGCPPAASCGHSIQPWMPGIGAQVLVLYLPVFNGDGFILGGI